MTNNKSTKATALLLSGVLATSCFVGGTLARYITTTMSEDSARVAVWGINADDVEMDLFASEYDANGNKVAKSWNGAKIIAPGTSMSSLFSIVNLDGTLAPEVMYEIKIDVDDTEIDRDILANPFIQWKLDDNAYGSWEDCKADILALSGDASGRKVYAPLEVATEFADGKTHTIYWRWMLDDNNVQDTTMGNDAVGRDIEAKISVKVTAKQVQEDVAVTSSAATLNGVEYATLQEAVDVASANAVITLNSDLTEAVTIDAGKSITLNLNGKDIDTTSDAIKVYGSLTVNGNGNVRVDGGSDETVMTVYAGGDLTINGGTYSVGPDANGLGNSCIYVNGGDLKINAGTFSTDAAYNGKYYVLNKNNTNSGSISITGGTFVNYNPTNGDDALGGSFVAPGYIAIDNGDGSYTVVAE